MDRNPRIQRNPPPQHLHQMESPATPEPDLPHVLVLKKPPYFSVTADHHITSTKFRYLNAFDSTLPLHEFLAAHARTPVRAMLASSRATVDAAVLDLLPELRVIVTTSAGVNHVDLTECRRRGIKIANAGDTYSNEGADCAVGLLIDVLRKISAGNRYVKGGLWSPIGDYPLGSKVGGKRIGIVGLGRIGYQIAKRLEAFGCSISYNSRKQKEYATYPFYEQVHELAANSDALIICCGLTEQTRHIIDKKVMAALGKEGVIVNIARGAVVDEQEMVRCLVEGEIGGAGLDVFENEPEVPQVLMKLDNVVLSPHCAVFTRESLMDIAGLVVGNLEAFFANKPLLSEYQDD
ncbi:Glyoxylate/hydroxypyruvate reductase HPR3 [Linum grandiflorum]